MIVLFDIDGTLVSTGGAGTRALDRAFEELFGIKEAFKDIRMAGKTDQLIMREGLRLHGIADSEENLRRMIERYLYYLQIEIENPRRKVMPGVNEIIEELKRRDYALGLLTGNLREGARIKLTPFGLHEWLSEGAFGSDHEDRNELLPIALKRFSSNGTVYTPEMTVVVGDTPRDIECAKVHGAHSVAVCTGPYEKESLRGADLIIETLEEIESFLGYLEYVQRKSKDLLNLKGDLVNGKYGHQYGDHNKTHNETHHQD